MSDNLRRATFRVGQAGLNGTGITAPEKTAITNDLTALKAATYITQTPDGTLSAEQALSTLATGLVKVTTGTGALSTAGAADLPAHTHAVTVGGSFLIDGGGAVIAAGIKGDMEIPFAGTITRVRVFQDQSGSIAISGWKDTLANYPPVVGDAIYTVTITTSAVPGDSGAVSIAVAAGDVIRHNVNSAATSITRATVAYTITRSV